MQSGEHAIPPSGLVTEPEPRMPTRNMNDDAESNVAVTDRA